MAGLEVGLHDVAARLNARVGEGGQQSGVIDRLLIIELVLASAFRMSVGGDDQPELAPMAAAFGEGEGIGGKMTNSVRQPRRSSSR